MRVRGVKRKDFAPVKLVYEHWTEVLLAMSGANGFYLERAEHSRGTVGGETYMFKLLGNELCEPLLQGLLLSGGRKADLVRERGAGSL